LKNNTGDDFNLAKTGRTKTDRIGLIGKIR